MYSNGIRLWPMKIWWKLKEINSFHLTPCACNFEQSHTQESHPKVLGIARSRLTSKIFNMNNKITFNLNQKIRPHANFWVDCTFLSKTPFWPSYGQPYTDWKFFKQFWVKLCEKATGSEYTPMTLRWCSFRIWLRLVRNIRAAQDICVFAQKWHIFGRSSDTFGHIWLNFFFQKFLYPLASRGWAKVKNFIVKILV